jgi:hypothetical protein
MHGGRELRVGSARARVVHVVGPPVFCELFPPLPQPARLVPALHSPAPALRLRLLQVLRVRARLLRVLQVRRAAAGGSLPDPVRARRWFPGRLLGLVVLEVHLRAAGQNPVAGLRLVVLFHKDHR